MHPMVDKIISKNSCNEYLVLMKNDEIKIWNYNLPTEDHNVNKPQDITAF